MRVLVCLLHSFLFLMLFDRFFELILINPLEGILVLFGRVDVGFNLGNHPGIDLFPDELSVVLCVGVIDAVGFRVDEHRRIDKLYQVTHNLPLVLLYSI